MRNTPSFIGEFHSKAAPKPKRCPSPHFELNIEKEASLREKKKKILQRLKKNVDPVVQEISRQVELEEALPDKVVFSPRTSKRFLLATQQLVKAGSGNEIKGLHSRDKTPLIVVQKAEEEEDRHGYSTGQNERVTDSRKQLRDDVESVSVYVPSFTEKPLRYLSDSPAKIRSKTSETKIPLRRRGIDIQAQSTKNRKSEREESRQESRVIVPVISKHRDCTTLGNSVNVFDNESDCYTGSMIQRSSSFHTIKERYQEPTRQIRAYHHSTNKVSSGLLSPHGSSSVLQGLEGDTTLSSASFAKRHQDKLEEDFQRVEGDLDRTFSELRKYLRTS